MLGTSVNSIELKRRTNSPLSSLSNFEISGTTKSSRKYSRILINAPLVSARSAKSWTKFIELLKKRHMIFAYSSFIVIDQSIFAGATFTGE